MEINSKLILPEQTLKEVKLFSGRAVKTLALSNIFTVKDLLDFRDKYGIESFRKLKRLGGRVASELYEFFSKVDSYVDTFAIIKDFVYSDKNIQNIQIDDMKDFFSTKAIRAMSLCDIHSIKDLIDFCDKYSADEFLKVRGVGLRTFRELHDFVKPEKNGLDYVIANLKKYADYSFDEPLIPTVVVDDLPEKQQIKKLKSDIKKYKLAIARMEAELEVLKNQHKTITKEQKEH